MLLHLCCYVNQTSLIPKVFSTDLIQHASRIQSSSEGSLGPRVVTHTCIKLNLELKMRTTVTIEDALFEKALELADPKMDRADIFREAMKTFVRVQAAKRLAALGGAMPEMLDIPRRGTEPAVS